MGKEATRDEFQVITTNRRARHEYFIQDTLETGLVLVGSEIKSIRAGKVSISDAYATIREGEMWVLNMNISSYDPASSENHDPLRPRKLLLHRREIARWGMMVQQKGFTIVPLRLYFRRGRAKLEIGLARGKRQYDKREAMAERDSRRQIDRAISDHRKGQR
ncbi:MAG: SsrA-binding protein SmpB [Anaerolineae bacterium]|nr:SsrA-binding protein SmpB [Anaerolineae bacterium]